MKNVYEAMVSGNVDFDVNTSMISTPFCRVYPHDYNRTAQYRQIRNITHIIWTGNKYFQHWRARNNSGIIEQFRAKNDKYPAAIGGSASTKTG